MDAGVILLNDKAGEKLSTHLVGTIKRTSTVNILRGELLVPIPGDKILPRNDGKKPHNYRVKGDPTITLLCPENDIAPLSNYEFLLLEGIRSRDARYQTFIPGSHLDWGLKLTPGADVYVVMPAFTSAGSTAVPTQATPRAAAKVRYVGGLATEPLNSGITFGVEIMEKKYLWRGTTDGTFQDHRYFQCRYDCGLFVSLEKLSSDREGGTLAKAPRGGQDYGTGGALNNMSGPEQGPKGGSNHDMTTPSKAKKGGQDGSSVDPPPPQFGKGDRVKVYNKKGVAVHGIVRWLGRKTAARDFKYNVVGIETDVQVRMEDFEFSQPGMAHLFAAKDRKCQLGMPEELVLLEGGQQTPPALHTAAQSEEIPSYLAKVGMPKEEVVAEEEAPENQVSQEMSRQSNVRQNFLENENATLKRELLNLQQSLSEQREETQRHKQELRGFQTECSRLASEKQRETQQNQKAQRRLQEECSQLQDQRDEALRSEQNLRQQVGQLQDRLQTAQAEIQRLRAAPQVTTKEVEFWKVPRKEVKIASHIGEGAWGYVAKGTFRGQEVAVKWPHKRLLDPYTINRLRREVRIMAQVRHPHLLLFIAAVFDREADRLEAPPMIITELLAMNLREAYKTGKLQRASKLSIYRDVACALNYLHQHQEPIIHRDVSAPNVLLEALPDGMWRAKLSDFGSANLAKLAQTMGEGAIIYSAPETIPALVHDPDSPPPPQTVKLDVYSYGVLLCEVTTSQFPGPDKYRTMLQQVQREWRFIYNLIVSCTKRIPEERPTMARVLDELNKASPS